MLSKRKERQNEFNYTLIPSHYDDCNRSSSEFVFREAEVVAGGESMA